MLTKDSALERVLRPFESEMPPEFARQILALHFADDDHRRYQDLSERAQHGTLTSDERLELDDLLTANDVLTILRATARASLNKKPAA